MIRDLGNCGNIAKIERIFKAFESAKNNECGLRFILDPLVYGTDNIVTIGHSNIKTAIISANKTDLFIMTNEGVTITLPWWDIDRMVQLW